MSEHFTPVRDTVLIVLYAFGYYRCITVCRYVFSVCFISLYSTLAYVTVTPCLFIVVKHGRPIYTHMRARIH